MFAHYGRAVSPVLPPVVIFVLRYRPFLGGLRVHFGAKWIVRCAVVSALE